MDSDSKNPRQPTGSDESQEPVWTYRGYRLKTGEFVTAMVHLFRAEIQRANVWRQRLDTTTNWAVVAAGAALSIAFSQPNVHHGIIILNTLLTTWFLFIEARRYRYYELWSYRIRLMETDFYAAMLVPPFHPSPEWAESLAENLLSPSFPISMWEAFGRRLRRNYLWIYCVLGLAWLAKSFLFPLPAVSLDEFIARGSIGPISGQAVLMLGAVYHLLLLLIAVGTIGMTRATGEILPRFGEENGQKTHSQPTSSRFSFPFKHRKQFLALIVTDKPQAVANRLLSELKRGVTSMPGRGMYTGQEHTVLMCAVTVTEIHNLKLVIAREDPQAFVIVSAAQEVFGRGFSPLEQR